MSRNFIQFSNARLEILLATPAAMKAAMTAPSIIESKIGSSLINGKSVTTRIRISNEVIIVIKLTARFMGTAS